MARQTGFCGDGCSFDRVDIDCSMAFRMVESTIRKIMGGFKERKGDEIVFAGLINSDDAISALLDSQHRSPKFLSSIPHIFSRNLSSSPQPPFAYSSTTPLLAQSKTFSQDLQGLRELSVRASFPTESTPLAASRERREVNAHASTHTNISPTPQQLRRLSSVELPRQTGFEVPSHFVQLRQDSNLGLKENTFPPKSDSRSLCCGLQASFVAQEQKATDQHKQHQVSAFEAEAERSESLFPSLGDNSIDRRKSVLDLPGSHQGAFLDGSFPSFKLLQELLDICPGLSHYFPPSMASESSEKVERVPITARRTDTPPRSIFDDYHSAYHSILSPDRSFSGIPKAADTAISPTGRSDLQQPKNPFADFSSVSEHQLWNPSDRRQAESVDTQEGQISPLPSSPKSKRRINFSRPMNLSHSSGNITRPENAMTRDSVSIFNLGSPRLLSQKRSLNTSQPNLHGARGRVDKSTTIGSIGKKYGDDSNSNRRGTESEKNVETRSSLDIMGCNQGMISHSKFGTQPSPAGEAPDILLPPDPSYVGARGLTGETFSEDSLYDNTEMLLNVARPSASGRDARSHQAASGPLHEIPDSQEGQLHSEFSWMGNSGRLSFRDLSVKELKQLQKARQASPEDAASKAVVESHDESYGDEYLLSDVVYQPREAAPPSATLAGAENDDARQAEMLSENLAIDSSSKAMMVGSLEAADGGTHDGGAGIGREPQEISTLAYGGLQSSSSHEVSLEASLRDGPFRPGLYMDESSLVSLVGLECADDARMDALAKDKLVIRSAENDAEDEAITEGDGNEGGEWETLGESGMRSKLGAQASIGRDSSGSSLANISSIDSTEDRRFAATPWDPLRPHPVVITSPAQAVIHQRRGHNAGVQEPATVPRYAHHNSDNVDAETLNRLSRSTSALPFPATTGYPIQSGNSPSYRHPTPLDQQHQNPFISSPPPVEVQPPGASYELSEFTDKNNDRRHAIYANSSRSLYHQIHKPTPQKFENRLKNSAAAQDTTSDTSQDGSFSTTYPTHLAVAGSSILNPYSSHTPKSEKSFTKGSIKRTKAYFTGSPRRKMSESRRYQRIREEMGCGTGGIVRVPGMQLVAPPSAHVPEELIGPTKPFRAAMALPNLSSRLNLPQRNSFEMTVFEPLTRSSTEEQVTSRINMANDDMNILRKKCPTFPINQQMLQTFFRNKDGSTTTRPKAKRGTILEKDGRFLEQAYCELHQRWEFSHTPRLTKRMPKDDADLQRAAGRRLVILLFLSVLGWIVLVPMVAWDPGHGRDDLIREYSRGRVHTFHEREILLARMLTGCAVVLVAVALALVGIYV